MLDVGSAGFCRTILDVERELPHCVDMVEEHQFTVQIISDEERPLRYRWKFCQGDNVYSLSPHSYATRREAKAEADKALKNLLRRIAPQAAK